MPPRITSAQNGRSQPASPSPPSTKRRRPRLFHQQTPIGTNNLPSAPCGIRSAQHAYNARDLGGVGRPPALCLGRLHNLRGVDALSRPHQWRMLDPPLDGGLELIAVGRVPVVY